MQSRCSKKSRKTIEKTSVLESLFNNAAGLRLANVLKRHISAGAFLLILENENFLRKPFLQSTSGRLLK